MTPLLLLCSLLGGAAFADEPADLVEQLPSSDRDGRAAIRKALEGPEGIRALVDALDHGERDVRVHAAHTLGLVGPPAESAVPRLLRMAAVEHPEERSMAVFALGGIGRSPEQVVPVLVERAGDADAAVRRNAVAALWQFGEQARVAVPTLREALRDPDPVVRGYAASALAALGE